MQIIFKISFLSTRLMTFSTINNTVKDKNYKRKVEKIKTKILAGYNGKIDKSYPDLFCNSDWLPCVDNKFMYN